MIKTFDKQMHVANCEYLLLSISCEMNADQSLFVVDLNERRSDSTNLVWSINWSKVGWGLGRPTSIKQTSKKYLNDALKAGIWIGFIQYLDFMIRNQNHDLLGKVACFSCQLFGPVKLYLFYTGISSA